MRDSYVHLNVHSEYSLVDGIIRIPQLIERCKKQKFSAVAITDLNNLFSAIKFNREAKKAGIKPIIGAEVTILSDNNNIGNYSSIFLCKNEAGYIKKSLRHLNNLSTRKKWSNWNLRIRFI